MTWCDFFLIFRMVGNLVCFVPFLCKKLFYLDLLQLQPKCSIRIEHGTISIELMILLFYFKFSTPFGTNFNFLVFHGRCFFSKYFDCSAEVRNRTQHSCLRSKKIGVSDGLITYCKFLKKWSRNRTFSYF